MGRKSKKLDLTAAEKAELEKGFKYSGSKSVFPAMSHDFIEESRVDLTTDC